MTFSYLHKVFFNIISHYFPKSTFLYKIIHLFTNIRYFRNNFPISDLFFWFIGKRNPHYNWFP